MIPIEALRKWHESVHTVLQREFPGLRIRCENQIELGHAIPRWKFMTSFFPPDGTQKYVAGYFTFEELENDQVTVLTTMGELPQKLKKAIKDCLNKST